MKLQSVYFDEIDYEEDQVIVFQQGLPGFDECRTFVFVQSDDNLPFSYLQSIERPELCFLVMSPFDIDPEYAFELNEATLDELAIQKPEDVEVWGIVTVPEQVQRATINLLAPLVINRVKRLGKQIILHNTTYTTKHSLMPQSSLITENKAGEGAC